MNRRSFCLVVVGLMCMSSVALGAENKKVLFLTKSSGFQHLVITRDSANPQKLTHAEQILTDIGAANGFTVAVTKDADIFNDPKTYETYQVIAFYTTEDLTNPSDKYDVKRDEKGKPIKGPDGKTQQGNLIHTEKPMSKEGKAMFLQAIADGKVGFIGFHSASDTFHSKNRGRPDLLRDANIKDPVDPYIGMIGGEFGGHGSQQNSTMKVASTLFPGLEDLKDFNLHEEWYSLYNLAPDMHVILVQDTNSMGKDGKREPQYQRAPYPATWAKKYGNGRVFYTSMGHKPEVWADATFQKVVIAGLNWAAGNTKFEPSPNIQQVAPQPTAAAVK
ncbi:MAG TPA: ThuA domain-containing protein [Tepidisphaeraceae bacterium]|nr:ThuA domain-containing protein [Tepidisphaeraceae bacterium]